MRFEWQHRGSPHAHGLAWLPDTPDVEQLLHSDCDSLKEDIIKQADQLVSTVNPAVLHAPPPQTDPHVCNKVYGDVQDLDEDLADLVATCQRHTRCSTTYCLRTKHGKQECRFGYPKPLQPNTAIITEEEPTLITARNDGTINSFAVTVSQKCLIPANELSSCQRFAMGLQSGESAGVFHHLIPSLLYENLR